MVELLAPAGTYESFIAAVKGGADAVYLGMKNFGARANAGNFTNEEIIKALEYAHLLNKKIYLTVNTLIKDSEYDSLYEDMRELYINGLDGVIVQDVGVIKFLSEHFTNLELHGSTQMAITDVSGALFAQKMGMTRVVPARELSLKELKNISSCSGIEIECFIHGAMCYSYSGKCLFSSFLGERSGNRGRCAQPCRLQYDNEYLLSMKDMCTIDIIPQLIDAGVASFKIEGRMKSPEYVYGVTSIYRKYIDLYMSGKNYYVDDSDRKDLLSIYSRGNNTDGYYFKKNGREMLTLSSPSYTSDNCKENEFDKQALPKLEIEIYADIYSGKKIRAKAIISDKCSSFFEKSFELESDFYADIALKAPLTKENVIKQFSKVNDTPYYIKSLRINLGDNVFVTNGQLNEIRRQLVKGLTDTVLFDKRRNPNAMATLQNNGSFEKTEYKKEKVDERGKDSAVLSDCSVQINIQAGNVKQLEKAIEFDKISGVILNYDLFNSIFNDNSKNTKLLKRLSEMNIFLQLPYIVRDTKKGIGEQRLVEIIKESESKVYNFIGSRIKGYYISNFEELYILNNLDTDKKIIADIHMYAFSGFSYDVLKTMGVTNTTVPLELNMAEIYRRNIKGEELIVYGKIPMMISSQCIVNTKQGCNYCERGNMTYVTDRKGHVLPVYTSCNECSNIIYNSIPLSVISENKFIERIKPSSLRLIFTDENVSQTEDIIGRLKESFENKEKIRELSDIHTKGHLKRGVD